jgi:hypothetical protein
MGVIVGSEANENVGYTAKSLICAYLQSDNRPIWGIMVWNTLYLKFDQVGFQEMVFVAVNIHLFRTISLHMFLDFLLMLTSSTLKEIHS